MHKIFQFDVATSAPASLDRQGAGRHSRSILLWITLLALLWQSLLVQTHVHPVGATSHVAATLRHGTNAQPSATHDLRDDPAICPLCQELDLAGHMVPPTPPLLYVPLVAAVSLYLSVVGLWTRSDRSHDWLGRGPPRRF